MRPPLPHHITPSPLTSLRSLAVNLALTFPSRIFFHARDTFDHQALIPGDKVSFIYESDEKGGKAREVTVEERAEADAFNEGPRETGKVVVSLTTVPYTSFKIASEYSGRRSRRDMKTNLLNATALECRQGFRIHRPRKRRAGVSSSMPLTSLLDWLLFWPRSTRS